MPEFQITIEHTIDFEVFCGTCGAGLCNQSDTRHSRNRGAQQVTVEVCQNCVTNAMDKLESRITDLENQLAEANERIQELENEK